MKAFVKALFGDTLNIAGVALIVAVAALLTETGHGTEIESPLPQLPQK